MSFVWNRILGNFRRTGAAVVDRPASWADFKIRPVSKEWKTQGGVERRPAYKTAVANVAYVWRDSSPTDCFGDMPRRFEDRRFELAASGMLLPASSPLWACDPYRIWEEADEAAAETGDPTAVSAAHVMMTLPPESQFFWKQMVCDFAELNLVSKGACVAWAIHAAGEADGDWIVHPHAHLVVTARHWRHEARHGQLHPAWLANRRQHAQLRAAWRYGFWARYGLFQ